MKKFNKFIAKIMVVLINVSIIIISLLLSSIPIILTTTLYRPENFYNFLAAMIPAFGLSMIIVAISITTMRIVVWKKIRELC